MKKFKFSLQKLLEYKGHMEEDEKAVLMKMRLQYERLHEELLRLLAEYEAMKCAYARMCGQGVVIKVLTLTGAYMKELAERIEEQHLKISKAEKEIDVQINKLTSLAQEKSALQKLKEHYFKAYRNKRQKQAEKNLDDFIANTKYSSQHQSG